MITIPVHDLLLLPGVMFYFKKDMCPDRRITAEDVGEDILFMMLKEEKKASELQPAIFIRSVYPERLKGSMTKEMCVCRQRSEWSFLTSKSHRRE